MDWYPTVMELCGIKAKSTHPKLDGNSLTKVIQSADAPSPNKVMHWQWHTGWAVRKGDWKLIGRGTKASFLGNLNDAQPERKNYQREKSEVVEDLMKIHLEWVKKVKSG